MALTSTATLGALVREARQRQGLTQAQLAERMGVTQKWVSKLERGNPRAEVQLVLDVFVALGMELDVRVVQRASAEPQAARLLPSPAADQVPNEADDDGFEDDDPFADVRERLGRG